MSVEFKEASPADADRLTQLCRSSKAYWGYTEAQMTAFAPSLTLTRGYILKNYVATLETEHGCIGFFALTSPPGASLDHFWISPAHIGQGYGRQMLAQVYHAARELGITSLEIVADPNAEGFYLKHGAQRTGALPSSIPGRFLPRLRLRVR